MSFLMINIPSEKRDYIINKCITKRISVYSADKPAEIQKILSSVDISHIYIGLSAVKTNWVDFLKELRQTEDGNKYKIIVSSDRQDKDYIKELLMLGIIGFIPANLNEEKTFMKLMTLIKATMDVNPNRKHFRVKIPAESPITVNFRIPNTDNFITGKLTDLSIVAMAIRLDKPTDSHLIEEGRILDKVQLKINKKLALINLKIVKAGPITVGTVVGANENTMSTISQFIYNEMMKKINLNTQDQRVSA